MFLPILFFMECRYNIAFVACDLVQLKLQALDSEEAESLKPNSSMNFFQTAQGEPIL